MGKLKHSELGVENWSHARWCDVHQQYHGALYPCKFYDAAMLGQLLAEYNDLVQKVLTNTLEIEGLEPNGNLFPD